MKPFEFKGYFFLPENKKNELPGILKFNPLDGIELDLFGQFKSYTNPASRENNLILGFNSSGKKITLLNCFESSRSMSLPGFPQSKFSSLYLFIGQHYETVEEITFNSCSIEYKDFNYWLDISGFDMVMYDKAQKEIFIKYKQPENILFEFIENWKAEIEFSFLSTSPYFKPLDVASIEQQAHFNLKPKQKEPFKNFEHNFLIFNSFLSLNYFTYPVVKSVVFFEDKEKEDELDNNFNKVELFFSSSIKHEKYKAHIHKHDFLLQLHDFKANLDEMMKAWYYLYSKIEASIDILTECFMDRGNPMELHFLSIVQAIENMHRRLTEKKISLNQRLNEIVNNLPLKVKEALLSNEIDFTKRVTLNRNFYTHYSENNEGKAASLSELFVLSEKLKIILMVSILEELPFTNNNLEKLIISKGVFLFNHIVQVKK